MGDWGKAFGDGVQAIGDGISDGIESGAKALGEGVDHATDKLGDGLEYIGAEGYADKVEDWGDSAASWLGAEVGEAQLGETEEANELVHGNPGEINATIQNLRDFKSAFDSVGQGLKSLDSSHWIGQAAEAFRRSAGALPVKWLQASDAFDDAAKALAAYVSTLGWAQARAKQAIALYKKGTESSKSAAEAHDKKVDAYKAALNGDNPLPVPAPFSDPGAAQRKEAHELLTDARRQRNVVAEAAKKAIATAMAHAPAEPSAVDRLKYDAMDYAIGTSTEMLHFAGGATKGVIGLVNFVRSVNPLDPYNLAHPAEYYKNVSMTLSGIVSTAANPDRALKNAWEAFKADPTEFWGRAIPELFGTKGAGGAKGIGGAAKGLPDTPKNPARSGHDKDPNGSGQHLVELICRKDPIDVATGRMVLPQTDITLPGSLPLVLQRTFQSSYRAGRWFGATWASTIDQHLEIDAEGVIFVGDEGSLLAYPHPAPGVPVMPTHGRRWPLNIDIDGDYTVTDPGTGEVRRFATRSAELAVLTQIDDRNGRWISFEYDEAGAPSSIVHHGGYHLKLTTHEGRITALHLADAAPDGTDQLILRYGYTDGHLTEVTNSSGCPLRFDYDERGRITSWTDTNGSLFHYVYDDQDRCIAQSGANGHLESRFTWDDTDPESGLRLTSVTDGLGHTERFLINERVQVVAEIDANGAVTRFERDRYNRLLSVTDPLGHVSRCSYDDSGRLTTAVRPDERKLSADYNELGLPTRVAGADGRITRQTYDDRGNRTSVTDASGTTTRFSYNEVGHLTSVTDALDHTTTVRCDKAGLPVEITDPLGSVTRYKRDSFGRPTAIINALGAITRLEWTVEGKLTRRVEADGSEQSWSYDGEGNCISHTDAMGGVSTYEYTDFDLLMARTGPDGARYELTHNTNLQLTQVTNPQGLTWSYGYDPAGRLITETDFDDRTLTYTYDAAGRLTSRTNGLGQSIRYKHNELGQVVRKNAEGSVTTFEYDIFDELSGAVGPDATLTRLRDRFGRLRSETVNGRKLTFDHDALGRRKGRTTPSGVVSAWTYDAAGRRTELTTSGRTLTFEYDAAGQELARHIGETVTLKQTFDVLGRLTDQRVTGHDRALQHRAYTYRADGNLVGIADQLSGNRNFDLDAASRVTAVHAANWAERYAYDEAGNQTDVSWPSSHPGHEAAGPRTYSGTRITRAGNVRYKHDAQGRIVLRQKGRLSRKPDTWRYEWDVEDRLTSVTTPDGKVWRYLYDPIGRRTAKQHLGNDGQTVLEQTSFTWDVSTLCEQTTSAETLPNPVTLTWDYDDLHPIAQTERIVTVDAPQEAIDERFFTIVTDLIGTPNELIDESGIVAWRTRSALWGTTTWAATSTAYTPLRFPGQYFDPETGLHYNYFRYYDPEIARYTCPDPIGLNGGPNHHWYGPNPHAWIDPFGLALCRAKPRLENGNPKEGWIHVDQRHIAGNHNSGHGDLMPPTTTRAQVEAAAHTVMEKGTRVSDPARTIQTFEKRMSVNGMRARYRLIVDSTDSNRIITFFPVGKSYTP
ncbi:putative T7SS-secreted protein [Streptomyces sp. NPDC000410]|uniref:putative T7SS-secreted protein n=1 Tax=Streptomyces sp. NPDC000410 TaxID=3154254 RepID=UPI003330182F